MIVNCDVAGVGAATPDGVPGFVSALVARRPGVYAYGSGVYGTRPASAPGPAVGPGGIERSSASTSLSSAASKIRIVPAPPSAGGPGQVTTRCVSGFTRVAPFAGKYETACASAVRAAHASAAIVSRVRMLR